MPVRTVSCPTKPCSLRTKRQRAVRASRRARVGHPSSLRKDATPSSGERTFRSEPPMRRMNLVKPGGDAKRMRTKMPRRLSVLLALFVLVPLSAMGWAALDCEQVGVTASPGSIATTSWHSPSAAGPCDLPPGDERCSRSEPGDPGAPAVLSRSSQPISPDAAVTAMALPSSPPRDRVVHAAGSRDPPAEITPLFIRHRALLI